MDVFSLELAIYFVLPPLVLFMAAYVSADIFVLVAKAIVEREIKRDTAVTAMAILIAATTSAALLAYWTSQQISTAIMVAPAAFFAVGWITCARLVLDYGSNDPKNRFGPIGLLKGFILSALLSACTIVPLAALAWFTVRPN